MSTLNILHLKHKLWYNTRVKSYFFGAFLELFGELFYESPENFRVSFPESFLENIMKTGSFQGLIRRLSEVF